MSANKQHLFYIALVGTKMTTLDVSRKVRNSNNLDLTKRQIFLFPSGFLLSDRIWVWALKHWCKISTFRWRFNLPLGLSLLGQMFCLQTITFNVMWKCNYVIFPQPGSSWKPGCKY